MLSCQFQSSPDSKVGCNLHVERLLVPRQEFQSSPDSKVGCNMTRHESPSTYQAFQSSPDSKVGCNWRTAARHHHVARFNPHPTLRSGATGVRLHDTTMWLVSILTRL